jgi:hypothetical protein
MITWKFLKQWWVSEASSVGLKVARSEDFYWNAQGRAIFNQKPWIDREDPDDGLMFGTENLILLNAYLIGIDLETPDGSTVKGVGELELTADKTVANVYSGFKAGAPSYQSINA